VNIYPRQNVANALYYEIFGTDDEQEPKQHTDNTTGFSDGEVIKRASEAANGDKFRRLFYDGDLSDHSGDDSRADQALCDLLHFWCGNDVEQIDRLFRRSALMRSKWDRDDYRERTIGKALVGEVCKGSQENNAPQLPIVEIDPSFYFGGDKKKTFIPKRLADAILSQHHFITFSDTKEIYVYDDVRGVYHPGGEAVAQKLTQTALQDQSRNAHVAEVEGHIRRNRFFNRDDLNADPDFIPVANGIIDRRQRTDDGKYKIISYSPKFPYISKIETAYDPNASYDEWVEYLETTIPGEVDLLQELFGDALYRDYWLKYAVMHHGEGDNGKTVILSVLDALLGTENVSHQSLEDIEKNRFAKANLFGKFANTRGDIGSKALRDTSNFKMLTGEDAIEAEKKFRDPFTFWSYAKQHYSCNELPPTRDVSPAFYGRWILLDYPYVFVNDPEPNTNQRKKSGKYKKYFLTPEKRSGILNWSIVGLERVLKNERFTETDASRNVKARWIAKTNTLAWFVGVMVTEDVGAYVDKVAFYDAYSEFCRDNGVGVQFDVDQVTRKLPTIITTSLFRPGSDKGKRPRAWKNISVEGVPRKEQSTIETQSNLKTGMDEGTSRTSHDTIHATREEKEEDSDFSTIINSPESGTLGTLELVKSRLSLRASSRLTSPSYDALVSTVSRDMRMDDRTITNDDIVAALNELIDTNAGRELITICVDTKNG